MIKSVLIMTLACCLSSFHLFSEESIEIKSHREFQFENESVKVWKTVVMPNQPLNMHRHDSPRVIVGLKNGTLVKLEETGETSQLVFEAGKAYWYDKDPVGELHADLNLSNESVEVMVIEIKH